MCVVLLPLRTKEEWEEVRQAVTNQPQDSSISEEFYKVSKQIFVIIYIVYEYLYKESMKGCRLIFIVCVCVQDRPAINPHSFAVGMKLEAVDPVAPFTISPATVAKVTHSPAQVTHLSFYLM